MTYYQKYLKYKNKYLKFKNNAKNNSNIFYGGRENAIENSDTIEKLKQDIMYEGDKYDKDLEYQIKKYIDLHNRPHYQNYPKSED